MYGNSIRLFSESSKKYAGIVDPGVASALRELIQLPSITLEATLSGTSEVKNKSRPNPGSGGCRLYVVVYGRRRESEDIGNILAEHGLHLQHPLEYDTSVEYVNPQYLLRPGRSINIPQSANTLTTLNATVAKDALETCVKNQILQVFDAANGPQVFSEIKPSQRLLTPLKGYVPELFHIERN